jgi:hypothetical protein
MQERINQFSDYLSYVQTNVTPYIIQPNNAVERNQILTSSNEELFLPNELDLGAGDIAIFPLVEALMVDVILEAEDNNTITSTSQHPIGNPKSLLIDEICQQADVFINPEGTLNDDLSNILPLLENQGLYSYWQITKRNLIRVANWTVKGASIICNPAGEIASISIFELTELLLKQACQGGNIDIFLNRLDKIEVIFVQLNEVAENVRFGEVLNIINQMRNPEGGVDNKMQLINELYRLLREVMEFALTPGSWINRRSQEFADTIQYTDETPDPAPQVQRGL